MARLAAVDAEKKVKGKEEYLYIVIYTMHSLNTLRRGSHSFTGKLHNAYLPSYPPDKHQSSDAVY